MNLVLMMEDDGYPHMCLPCNSPDIAESLHSFCTGSADYLFIIVIEIDC